MTLLLYTPANSETKVVQLGRILPKGMVEVFVMAPTGGRAGFKRTGEKLTVSQVLLKEALPMNLAYFLREHKTLEPVCAPGYEWTGD